MKHFYTLLIAISLCNFHIYSQITSTANGSWDTPATWTGGIIPESTDNVTINHDVNISTTKNHTANITVNLGRLTIEKTGNLTITGILDTGNDLILESDSNEYSSLIATTVIGEISYKRAVNSFTNDGSANDNDLIASPIGIELFQNIANNIDNGNILASGNLRAFAPFDKTESPASYVNFDVTGSDTVEPGIGYRAATSDGGTITFQGSPNLGTISIDIEHSGTGFEAWNLIGNPYSSYIDAEAFLTHEVAPGVTNASLLDVTSTGIYGYDGDVSDDWVTITLANDAGKYIAPGQGFFVAADATKTAAYDIEFTPSMRAVSTADDFISGRNGQNGKSANNNALTFVKLRAFTANNAYVTDIYFNSACTLGLDPGYDAMIFGGVAPSNFSLYTHLVEESTGVDIALQAVGSDDINNVVIPVGINANAGEQLTFTLQEVGNIPQDVDIYLDDMFLNTSTPLKDIDYIFTPTQQLSGIGRFYIRFENTATALTLTENTLLDMIKILPNNSTQTIDIIGELQKETMLKVFDVQGRLTSARTLNNTDVIQTVDVSHLSSGIYVVQLNNSSQMRTQKVIIN